MSIKAIKWGENEGEMREIVNMVFNFMRDIGMIGHLTGANFFSKGDVVSTYEEKKLEG